MKQYYEVKSKHPDAILLFRVGDFYETFDTDAVKASQILGITLAKRANGSASFVDLAGFPYHALDTYLPKLVRAGQRVAICEQLEDPKTTKTIVKRGVTELVTPGISVNDNVLEHKENNYLACVHFDKNHAGVAFLDISTGEFYVTEGRYDYIDKLLNSFKPKEILFERSHQAKFTELFGSRFYIYPLDDWMFVDSACEERLLKQFEAQSLKGFGVQGIKLGTTAAGAVLHYLDLTHNDKTKHITRLARIEEDKYVWLDKFTVRNLELYGSMHEGGKGLINIIDKTVSPMGARTLRRWIALPLKEPLLIKERQIIVGCFVDNQNETNELTSYVQQIGDMERLVSKVSLLRISPREVVMLKNALTYIPRIKTTCQSLDCTGLSNMSEQLNPCSQIRDRIAREIQEDPPTLIHKGGVIAKGVSEELDELRKLAFSGKDYLAQLQKKLAEETGISSLKVGYNNVYGYYFEVRNAYKDKVPEGWTRKQTLTQAERYINEELKEYEGKILGAEEKILVLETKLFNDLIFSLSEYIESIQLNSSIIAKLDCLLAFANLAKVNNYTCPEVNDSDTIHIIEGRHPVIEQLLPMGEEYISNDIKLNNNDQQVIIITGPNMSGKSALLRQTALIVLMAQIGSYVPAKSASIGYVDKIFTRVGASDNISLGESTFMVEMNEAASILNNISDRSLILFDELGRGTSTYDGISIAWAIVEYIHEYPSGKAKTLFATHYHELNEMENSFKRIKNFNVSVKELNNRIIFMRKLARGGSEHSFGIHVAKMAGMPKSVVARANEILIELEKSRDDQALTKPVKDLAQHRSGYQLSFFQLDDPVLKDIKKEIDKLDINCLTPIEALNKLNDIKRLIGAK